MAYTKITRTAHGREALAYALNGRGHDGSEQRNLYVGSVNMLPPDIASYAEQMERYWIRADGKNKTQINRIIVSFSPNELDPDDPESPLRAAQICDEFVRESYPGRQAVICVQNDGEGHNIHVHALVSNVSMCEVKLPGEEKAQKPYAGCKGYQVKFDYVKANFNNVAERYITLDQGEKAADKATQNERRMRQHNRHLAPGEQAKYIWKDDLKDRVKKAMSEASDKDDFLHKLTENGVEGKFHETKKGRRYYTYELTDISGFGSGKVPQNLKARSDKMGTDYGCEAIDRLFPDRPEPVVPKTSHVPHTGHQDVLIPESTPAFEKWQNEPSNAVTRGMYVPCPRSGHKQQDATIKTAPDMPKTTPEQVQVTPPPPDQRQEKAKQQRKEKERMEAENRRRQEVLRRQMEKDSKKAAIKQQRDPYDTPGFRAAMQAAAGLAEKWKQEESEKDDYDYNSW